MEVMISVSFVCGGIGVLLLGISTLWFGWQEHKRTKDVHEEAMFNILLDTLVLFKESVDKPREDDNME